MVAGPSFCRTDQRRVCGASFGLTCDFPDAATSVHVRALAQDDGTEKDQFAAQGDDDPWWEDTFFDGSFSQASRGDDYRYGTTGSVSSEHLMGSMGQQVRLWAVLLLSHTPPASRFQRLTFGWLGSSRYCTEFCLARRALTLIFRPASASAPVYARVSCRKDFSHTTLLPAIRLSPSLRPVDAGR